LSSRPGAPNQGTFRLTLPQRKTAHALPDDIMSLVYL
jgi:hypothetical protein